MSADPFDDWLQKTASKTKNEPIPTQILERLPKQVLTLIHEKQKKFYVLIFCLGLTFLLGSIAVTVIWQRKHLPVPYKSITQMLRTNSHLENVSNEEIVTALASIEEERLWQLGPEVYSANLEMMDWVTLGR